MEVLKLKQVSLKKKISYDIKSKTQGPEDPKASLGYIMRPYLKPLPPNAKKA